MCIRLKEASNSSLEDVPITFVYLALHLWKMHQKQLRIFIRLHCMFFIERKYYKLSQLIERNTSSFDELETMASELHDIKKSSVYCANIALQIL